MRRSFRHALLAARLAPRSSLLALLAGAGGGASAGCRPQSAPPNVAVIASDAAPPTVEVPPAPSEPPTSTPPAPLSYEQALALFAGADKPDGGVELTDAQLAAPMRNASFISGCGAPDTMKVTVRAVVLDGAALGVSVYPNPLAPEVARCVELEIRRMHWAPSPHHAAFTTTY